MLGHRHELHVGVALPADVLDQFGGQILVRLPAPPAAQMHLVDGHRFLVQLRVAPVLQPGIVVPLVVAVGDHHRGGRRGGLFGVAGVRVGAVDPAVVGAPDLELVDRPPGSDPPGQEDAPPDSGVRDQPHGGVASPSQSQKSPKTRTSLALGAHTVNRVPLISVPDSSVTVTRWAPSRFQASVSPPGVESLEIPPVDIAEEVVGHGVPSNGERICGQPTQRVEGGMCSQSGRLRAS